MSSSKHLTFIVFLLIIFYPPNSAHPGHVTGDSTERIEVLMPGLAPQVESNLCTSVKLNKSTNIIGYEPKAKMPTIHHILLFGCEEPGSEESVWSCGEMGHSHGGHHQHHQSTETFKPGSVCSQGYEITILYAWAKDAPTLMLPAGVGFKVGPGSKIRYIVLQAHYGDVSQFLPPNNNKDHSGVVLLTKSQNQPKQAGVFLTMTGGTIPSLSTTYLEAACQFREHLTIHPFAFRTHTHKHGKVVSGYRVRGDKWTEIGRKDPQLPQMFYNVTNPGMTIEPGDILASRCTMVNEEHHDVEIGTTSKDEMCNFYMMFYVDGNETLEQNICATSGYPLFRWKDYFRGSENIPSEASVVPGTNTILEESDNRLLDGDYNSKADGPKMFDGDGDDDDDDDDEEEEEGEEDEEMGNDLQRVKNSYPGQLYLDNVEDKYGYPVYEYPDKVEDSYVDKEKMVDLLKELSAEY